MISALKKYSILCTIGVFFLFLAVVFIFRTFYQLIFVSAFVGVMIINAAGKRITCLLKARRALQAGKEEVFIYYQDGNLEESKHDIIPVAADANWLYGYLTEKEDIKQFRWKGIFRTSIKGKDLNQEDILKYIESIPEKNKGP